MTKGRKKLPDSVKTLRGTDQPCRMDNLPAPVSISGAPLELPKSGLKGTAKKIYSVVGTELLCNNLLDIASLDLMIAYCREMGLYTDMMRDLEKEGMTLLVETKTGTITQINPKRKIAETALSAAKSLAAEFGLSPSSRARVAALLNAAAPKDDFADFEVIDIQ